MDEGYPRIPQITEPPRILMISQYYAIDNIVECTDLTASYCYECHPMFHFADVDLIKTRIFFHDLDILHLLSDIQWDFTVCLMDKLD